MFFIQKNKTVSLRLQMYIFSSKLRMSSWFCINIAVDNMETLPCMNGDLL